MRLGRFLGAEILLEKVNFLLVSVKEILGHKIQFIAHILHISFALKYFSVKSICRVALLKHFPKREKRFLYLSLNLMSDRLYRGWYGR